jgi:hypothetical protein
MRNTLAIATSLVASLAFAVPQPALAKPAQSQSPAKQAHVVGKGKTQSREAESCGDPYWDCCLSYYRSWGPGACGR